jgi:shikimate kinase
MKIYLIGMPGSGKTTLGKQLSQSLSMPFIDLDKEIESRENESIENLFRSKGEDYFRVKESEVLRELAATDTSFVMATGGGAPCFFNNMETLNSTGLTVFLDVPIDVLTKRVEKSTKRPLLNQEAQDKTERLKALYNTRYQTYKTAKVVVCNPDLESIYDAITRNRLNK